MSGYVRVEQVIRLDVPKDTLDKRTAEVDDAWIVRELRNKEIADAATAVEVHPTSVFFVLTLSVDGRIQEEVGGHRDR